MTAPAVPGRHALTTPSLARRMASLVYESLLLFGIGLIPGAIGALFVALTGQRHPLQSEFALQLIAVLIYAVYFGWFWSARGQTLPMKTWHIRVVTAQGQPLSQGRALVRFIASCAWVAPAVLLAHLNGWSPREALAAVGVGARAASARAASCWRCSEVRAW